MATAGTFVLADIGGYTGFLTGVGIEHGKEITSHLLNSLLKCNRGRWKLANIEGDCLFLYREGRQRPEELLEHVRILYEDFCDRTVDIAARASCPCGACSRTNELSLKFIVHAGEFATQKIGKREELIGPEIVVAHRLLKNGVATREYALLTSAYLDGRTDSVSGDEGADQYDDVGNIEYIVSDLSPVRADMDHKRQFFLKPEDAKVRVVEEIDVSADVVAGVMKDLDKRPQWQTTIKEDRHVGGEPGAVGEIHRCVHTDGSKAVHFTVAVDEETRRRTERIWVSPLVKDCYLTAGVEPLGEDRCQAYFYLTFEPGIPVVSHLALPILSRMIGRSIRKDLAGLKALCEQRTEVGG